MSEVSSSKNRLSSTLGPPIVDFANGTSLFDRQRSDRRAYRSRQQQGLGNQHEFVNVILRAVGAQGLQIPDLAQHHAHLAQTPHMEQDRPPFELPGTPLHPDLINRPLPP